MSDEAKNVKAKKAGVIARVFFLPIIAMGIVFLSILISVAIEWLGIGFGWWVTLFDQHGSDHAYQTLQSDLGWIDIGYKKSIFFENPGQELGNWVQNIYRWLFIKTGITSFVDVNIGKNGWLGAIAEYLKAAMYIVLTTLVRLMILLLTSPLFLLAAVVGFVDGLVRRDLRKAGAGRESAFIYHHAKRAVSPVFIIGWLLYLSLPFSVHPNWFLLPNAFLFGLFISIASGSFKKYL